MSKTLKSRKPCKKRAAGSLVSAGSVTARKKRHRRVASLEDCVVGLAISGNLAKASRGAIRNQLDKGLPITFQRGTQIVKQYPDGHEEVLGTVKRSKYKVPKDVIIISSK